MRDGRAVVNSRIKHPNWSSDVVEASVRWTTDANWELRLGEICGEENVLRVHYESFLKEPEFIEARLLEFIGATASSSPHSETQAIYGSYNSYFSQPWMQKSTTKIDTDREFSWLSDLTVNDIKVIEFFVAKRLTAYGYKRKTTIQFNDLPMVFF